MSALEFHPLADVFPLVAGRDFDELVADIRDHGLHEPIVVYEDKILDGRNRLRACEAAGVVPQFEIYTGDDPVAYVVSLNLRRRHLDESQRAMVAAKLATLKQGARTDLSPIGEMSQGQAATLLNVGKRSVERAAEVRDHGAPELVQAVERGEVSVAAAADVATLPAQEQQEIVARGEREILQAAQKIRERKSEQRRAERIARIVATVDSGPLPQGRKYPLILADPPWRYEFSMTSARAIENHYETMALEEVCALPVSEIAAPAAVLFLWVPPAILEQAFSVIGAWGFSYRSGAIWNKQVIGAGHYFRQQHEHLLLATRGDMPTPSAHDRPASIIAAPRREHSRKPDEAYELIERMYPELPKIELIARQSRPGWAAWGNEITPARALDDGIPSFLRRAP
jgi:N6-adenosine-specific RNA methylase IME4/ParB-like chromosome segregation protein Spo0J